ncbi:hypothetical protein BH10PSE16_BH10PSE16_15960 [soil metagenome]
MHVQPALEGDFFMKMEVIRSCRAVQRMKGGRALGKALDSRLRGNDGKGMNGIYLKSIKFDSSLRPYFMGKKAI